MFLLLFIVFFFKTSISIDLKTLTLRLAHRTIVSTGLAVVPFVFSDYVLAQTTENVLPTVCGNTRLEEYDQQGRGGTGLVFKAKAISLNNKPMAVKLSWPTTVVSVRKECEVLRLLEKKLVGGVEKCVDSCDTVRPPSQSQAIIVLDPFFAPPSTATLTDLTPSIQLTAVKHLTTTIVQMLLAGVATSDLQPLINPITGDSLLIDLSEAMIFANPKQPTDRDILAGVPFFLLFSYLHFLFYSILPLLICFQLL